MSDFERVEIVSDPTGRRVSIPAHERTDWQIEVATGVAIVSGLVAWGVFELVEFISGVLR